MKKITKFFVLMLTLILIFSLAACNPEEEQPIIDPNAKLEVMPNNNNNDNHSFIGKVKDLNYNSLADIEIFFGEDEVLATSTDENGNFSFFFKDPHNYTPARASDFILIDTSAYIFKIFIQEIKPVANNVKEIKCLIIVDSFDSEIDLNASVIPDFYMKSTFHQNDVVLPPGYVSRGIVYENGGVSANGDTTLSGVNIYVNDNLICTSNDFGFFLEYIVVGSALRFEKEGFSFVFRLGTFTDLVDDTYIFTGLEVGMLEFRGKTDDLNVLVN